MKKLQEIHWGIPDNVTLEKIQMSLSESFVVRTESETPSTLVLYDDPDWSIWRSGAFFLVREGGEGELHIADSIIKESKITARLKFHWDYPEGELRQELARRVKYRAIQAKLSLLRSAKRIEVLNEDQKIVVRVSLEKYSRVDESDYQYFLSVKQLRGYEKEYRAVVALLTSFLNDYEISSDVVSPDTRSVLMAFGCEHAPVQKVFGISKNEAAENAVRKMSLIMVGRAHQQKDGIIADIDTEYLHDYRVNLRKARSLINLTKQTLAPEKHLMLKDSLSKMAGATNTLRDLDVFLLDEKHYRQMLPDIYADGLSELFKLVANERKASYRGVTRYMKSRTFTSQMESVCEELACEPDYFNKVSRMPVMTLANKKILNRYQTICRLGAEIHADTPDDDVHEIRIDCKKLRYLMEFFAELYPKKRLNNLVKRLKNLQNVLGKFNDYSVQKIFIQQFSDPQKYSEKVTAAVNGMVAVLHQNQLAERKKVEAALREFSNEIVETEFKLMFKN